MYMYACRASRSLLGPAQQRLDRLGRQPHDLGDLGVVHVLELVQDHRHPLPFVEPVQRLADDGGQFLLLQAVRPALRRGRRTSCSAGRGPSGPESRTSSGTTGLRWRPRKRVQGEVVGDGEQPGRELRLAAVYFLRLR